ncbi:MAG: CapA family protein, partial [Tepidiformaceae bacterium]
IQPSIGCVPGATTLSSPPQVMAALTLAGIDEVTVATNHIFDCGESACGTRAFLQTLDLLHGAGITTVGGGKNLTEALAPAIFEIGGVKFGVLGFDDIAAEDLEANNDPAKPESQPGTAPLDDSYADEKASLPQEPAFYKPASMLHVTQMQSTIQKLKTQVDVVIVQVQSGFEDTHDASPRSIKGLRAAVDAGADIVVGNQGHSVQPMEVRGNAFIAYALGNFIYDQQHTVDETQGYLLEATFWGKKLAAVKLVPYQIADQYRPEFVTGDTRAKILGDVADGSAALPAADSVITN